MSREISPEEVLRDYFERAGYLRIREADPRSARHGGVELRIVVNTPSERREVVSKLRELKVGHGRVYRKQKGKNQWVIPLYSRADVLKFLRLVWPKGAKEAITKIESTIKRASTPRRSRLSKRRQDQQG